MDQKPYQSAEAGLPYGCHGSRRAGMHGISDRVSGQIALDEPTRYLDRLRMSDSTARASGALRWRASGPCPQLRAAYKLKLHQILGREPLGSAPVVWHLKLRHERFTRRSGIVWNKA